ncbi:hypothetical protein K439DRAFT_880003 [Ramaria rubella]|nr:hypothetical protein K439DRAFT_880003 [Ramaria rubella]
MKWLRHLSIKVSGGATSTSTSLPIPLSNKRYPVLSHLPKAPAIRSIRFKRTTPGSVSHLAFAPSSSPVLDSSHPLAHLSTRKLLHAVPCYQCTLFEAHAYPHAVLRQWERPEIMKQLKAHGDRDTLDQTVYKATGNDQGFEEDRDSDRATHALPMSIMILVPKKPVHRSGIVRSKIKLRIKEALSLVAIRGAVAPCNDKADIVLRTPEGISNKDCEASMILQGWTYVIRPSLEAYRIPWPHLLKHVREALLSIKTKATELENQWAVPNRHNAPHNLRADLFHNQRGDGRFPHAGEMGLKKKPPKRQILKISNSQSGKRASESGELKPEQHGSVIHVNLGKSDIPAQTKDSRNLDTYTPPANRLVHNQRGKKAVAPPPQRDDSTNTVTYASRMSDNVNHNNSKG